MIEKEETSFPIRKEILIIPGDDPNKRKICFPIYVEEGVENLVQIFSKENKMTTTEQSGGPCHSPDPRVRNFVNCCWNCRSKTVSTDAEHEDGGGQNYYLMDGCNVSLFQTCKDWENDS